MLTLILTWFLYSLAVTLLLVMYTVDDESDGETAAPATKEIIGFVMPRYGGTPVYINQAILAAQEVGDREAEQELNRLRSKFFRNRRSPEEKSREQKKAEARWIKKYGTAALDHDRRVAKLKALTQEEQDVLIAAWEAQNKKQIENEEALTPIPKVSRKKKAGGK